MSYSGSRFIGSETPEASDSGALPRFRLPDDPASDRLEDDAAETLERPAVLFDGPLARGGRLHTPYPTLSHSYSRRDVPPPPSTDELEVQVQDILLEAYVEEPAPRSVPQSSTRPSLPPPLPARATAPSIPAVPRTTAPLRPVMASMPEPNWPALSQAPPQPQLQPQLPQQRPRPPRVEQTPSLTPVAMSTSLQLARRAGDPTIQLRPTRRGSTLVASVALIAAALVVGAVVGVATLSPGGLAHARAVLLERFKERPHEVAVTPAAVATPSPVVIPTPVVSPTTPTPVVAPPVAVASASIPAVAVDALPGSKVEPTMTLVTLPRSAKGHRVFVDGRVVASGAEPLKLRCGKHKIQIGSGGKAKVEDLPCGGALTLE